MMCNYVFFAKNFIIKNKLIAKYPTICNSVHLPFQSGSNRILKMMNRGYTIEDYKRKIKIIKETIPNVSITTDIIVGFPTESDEDFNATMNIVKEVGYDNVFSFIYSQRKGTKAAEKFKDDISREIKVSRLQALKDLQHECGLKELEKDVGKIKEVLVERESKKNKLELMGRTEQFRIVVFENKNSLKAGMFAKVKITKAKGVTLFGTLDLN